MTLIVNNVETENVIVKKISTGQTISLDVLQDNLGNIIWQKYVEIKDLIYNVTFTSVNYKSPTLKFTKQDTQPTTINWGDGSAVETITTSGTQAVNHTYETLGDYTITISGEGKINIDAGALGSTTVNSDSSSADYGKGYPTSIVGVVFGEIVDRIEAEAFWNAQIEEVSIHPNVTYIGRLNDQRMFTGCEETTEYIFINGEPSQQIVSKLYYLLAEDGTTKYCLNAEAYGGTEEYETRIPEGTTLLAEESLMIGRNIVVPASVKYFCKLCLGTTTGFLRFEQPEGMEVFLPIPGDGSGMAYSKEAVERTIYTDNATIKNYNWAGDNITATILHLDGTAWE